MSPEFRVLVRVTFDQWPNLYLRLSAEPEIQRKVTYYIPRSFLDEFRLPLEIAIVVLLPKVKLILS